MLKRKTPLKRTPIKKKPYKIKRVSAKTASANRKYSEERKKYFEDEGNQFCQARLECNGAPATDIHHIEGRGIHLLDTSTWLPVCRKCHCRIETHPEEAKEKGFSRSRLKNNDSILFTIGELTLGYNKPSS